MTTIWPEVLEVDRSRLNEGRVTVALRVAPELPFFAGHFPGAPILPGVIQLHWAVWVASRYFRHSFDSRAVERLKFHRMIRPCALLTLDLWLREGGSLQFEYSQGASPCSSGRIRVECSD